MTDVDELADRLAINELLGRYGYHYDEHRIDEWLADLFTADAVCTRRVGDQPTTVARGHDEIRALLQPHYDGYAARGIQRRHLLTGVWIDGLKPARAHAHGYMLIASTTPGEPSRTAAAGHYDFDLVKRDGRWWIAAWTIGLDAVAA